MAKNGFGKILAGIGVIGAGVALGLAIYNRLDVIRRELNEDEFEDDFDDDEDYDDDSSDDDTSRTYVTIHTASDEESSKDDSDDSENE